MNATECEMRQKTYIYIVLGRRSTQHTFIDDRCFVTVVDQSRQLSQVVFVGQCFVMNLHKTDSELISLIVDIFQFLQSLGTFAAFGFVCSGVDRKNEN
jgi:hypothetical protein